MLNYEMHEVKCPSYYRPTVIMDLRPYDMYCTDINTITILMKHPRQNIDMISAVFRFYFDGDTPRSSFGQVHSHYIKIYNLDDQLQCDKETDHCILFLDGTQLTHIIMYMPYHKDTRFLREIRSIHNGRRDGTCIICLEDTELINLHNDEFNHEVCRACLLKIENCPICRSRL